LIIPFLNPKDEIEHYCYKYIEENISPHNTKVSPASTPRDFKEGEDLVGS
jgi:hypothetical protein